MIRHLARAVSQTRRNHAVEHATIHLLNRRFPTLHLVGWSGPFGFYIHGHVSADAVQSAVQEALARLRRGESYLAVHPRCGTNIVTAGTLAGLVSFLAMLPGSDRDRRTRLPLVVLLSTLALLFAQPLGTAVQQWVTTDPHLLGSVEARISYGQSGQTPVHRVELVSTEA
ncbi:MAG: DUF6391 domain-containing protein [Anaerolineae bacterium]|jgi:hypothetical protein